jgi:hypothetical protein
MGEKENMKEINKITYIFVKLSRHLPGIYQKIRKCQNVTNTLINVKLAQVLW